MSRETPDSATEHALLARRRLTRLLDALPVFSGFCSADGHLLQTRPPTQESFLWALPQFSYSHESITQIVDLCDRAARGERVQVERPYRAVDSADPGPLLRGLLTLDPVMDDDGFVDELAVSLIDADRNGLVKTDAYTKNRLQLANQRIGQLLSLAQTVIEALAFRPTLRRAASPRDAIARRLDVLSRVIDPFSDPDARTFPVPDAVAIAFDGLDEDMRQRRLVLDLDAGQVPLDALPLFVLLLAELADNARAHGAWKREKGRVTVQSEVIDTAEGRTLRLHWLEDGGPEVSGAPAEGFGLMLGKRLFAQMTDGRAVLLNQPDGLCWTFELPIPMPASPDPDDIDPADFDGGFAGNDRA